MAKLETIRARHGLQSTAKAIEFLAEHYDEMPASEKALWLVMHRQLIENLEASTMTLPPPTEETR